MKKLIPSLIGLSVGLFAAVSLHAQSITLTNASFEAGNGYNGGSPLSSSVLPGWTTASSGGGSYGNTINCTSLFTSGLSGTNAIEVGGEIDQLTAATFTTGQTYTMTVDIGNPLTIANTSATVTFGFRNTTNNGFISGGSLAVSAATINAIPDGTFQTFSITYTAVAGDNGNGIRIGIADGYNGPYDYRLDNVTLAAASAIPEPSTYAALAGVGVLGFVLVSRRRRAASTG